jgi:hypothetical protein
VKQGKQGVGVNGKKVVKVEKRKVGVEVEDNGGQKKMKIEEIDDELTSMPA